MDIVRYNVRMSRYRLQLAPEQESALLRHCSDARYIWNLAVEQHAWWRPGRTSAPGYLEQSRQLTAARAANPWLTEGSQTVQQQALRDFDQATRNFFAGTHRRPTWRKAGQHEGFRVVDVKPGDVRRLSRHRAEVKVPKVGWVRFRWSRPVPGDVKSYRVTRDRAGRWHVAFVHIPHPVPAPGTGEVVGVDRGVKVTAALSTGEMLSCPGLSAREQRRLVRLERRLAKARRGSNRRGKVKASVARLKARETDRRKDWVEKTSTDLARRFDVIRVEDLKITSMTRSASGTKDTPGRNVAQKTGLNRGIGKSGWGLLASRLEDKAPGRVEKVPAAYTSQRCSACGHVARENRESQAAFLCTACNFACNADVNAARNIAAGHAVKARGGDGISRPMNREPQLTLLAS
jgi:putative transposase